MSKEKRYEDALKNISALWPTNPYAASINPVYVGPNDGKSRAILLEAAINVAREALEE